MGCPFLLQRILLTQGSNLNLLELLHWLVDSSWHNLNIGPTVITFYQIQNYLLNTFIYLDSEFHQNQCTHETTDVYWMLNFLVTVSPLYIEASTCRFSKTHWNVGSSNIRCEWNCSLPSVSYCRRSFSSTISHLPFLLQSVTPRACSLDASPCVPGVVMYSCTFQGAVRSKLFYFLFVFYVLFVSKVL